MQAGFGIRGSQNKSPNPNLPLPIPSLESPNPPTPTLPGLSRHQKQAIRLELQAPREGPGLELGPVVLEDLRLQVIVVRIARRRLQAQVEGHAKGRLDR